MNKYVITGGAGFIGSNLVGKLLQQEPDCKIVVLDNMTTGSYDNILRACKRHKTKPFRGTIVTSCPVQDIISLIYQANAVFHLGAITDTTVTDEVRMLQENNDWFRDIVQGCLDMKVPLVYASSAAVYGTPPQVETKQPFPLEAAGWPNNCYGFSKWMMEQTYDLVSKSGIHMVGLRYFNVFGPNEEKKGKMASMVYKLARQMMNGTNPQIFKDGEQSRDQVYVDDVVDCTIAAASKNSKSGIYNVGSGEATSFNEIVRILRECLGSELETKYIDMDKDVKKFYQSYTCADLTATKEGLGWSPKWKFADAVGEYVSWLKNAGVA